MMTLLQSYSKEIAALVAVLLAFILNQGLRPKAKVVYGIRNTFTFLVDEPLVSPDGTRLSDKQVVHTASIAVRNAGREPAENVEVTFNWKPQFLNVSPPRHYEEKASPLSRHSIVFPSIAPKEGVQMEIMAINAQLPLIAALRSDQCVGLEVQLQPQQVMPTWSQRLLLGLLTLGIAAAGYILVWLIQFAAQGVVR